MKVDLRATEAALSCLKEGKALRNVPHLTHTRRAALMAQLADHGLVTRPGRKYRLTEKGVKAWEIVQSLNQLLGTSSPTLNGKSQ